MDKNIGFDVHGVIDHHKDMFKNIIDEFIEANYVIHILTGSKVNDRLLNSISHIKYHHIFSILDFNERIGTDMWEDDRGFWIDDYKWNMSKSYYAHSNNLLFHLDDTKIYGDYFKTPFGHYDKKRDIIELTNNINPTKEILTIYKNNGYEIR